MLLTTTFASVVFPAISLTLTLIFVLAENVFVNCFLSEDKVHPDTGCISSLAFIVTVTFSLVI